MSNAGEEAPQQPYRIQAVIFLTCNSCHIFTLPDTELSECPLNEIEYIFAPCPGCPPPVYLPNERDCAFCWSPMEKQHDGTSRCNYKICWLGHASTVTSSMVWGKIWNEMGNMHFPWAGQESDWITGGSDGKRRRLDRKQLYVGLPRKGVVPTSPSDEEPEPRSE